MPAAILIAIQALEALLQLVPQIPEVVEGVKTAIELLNSGQAPTPEQKAKIDNLLDAAHRNLQTS